MAAEYVGSDRQRQTQNEHAISVHSAIERLSDSRTICVKSRVKKQAKGCHHERQTSDVPPNRFF
jgi:hypothetical protein